MTPTPLLEVDAPVGSSVTPAVDPAVDPAGRALLVDARRLLRAGSVREALTLLQRAPRARLGPLEQATLEATLLDCHLARGDLVAARAVGESLASRLPLDGPGSSGRAVTHHALGELASALGEPETALGHFLEVADDALAWRVGAALALLRLGRRLEARELALEHHDATLVLGTTHGSFDPYDTYDVALSLRTLATVDGAGERIQRLRAARTLSVGAARLRAQIDTDLAGLLLLAPRDVVRVEALMLLREAESYARSEGLWPLSGRVRRLLELLGETPRHLETEVLAALTPAERRVTVLVLADATNRQVAEQLLISIKAVEGHLSRVYRKLGVTSRTALTASLRTAPDIDVA